MYLINLSTNDLKWLQKALNKKDTREFCKLIVVKEGYAYATNGHVCHKVCTIEDQEGLYSYDGIKIDASIRHPLINSASKLFNNNYPQDVTLTFMSNNLNALKINNLYTVNKKYLDNALDKTNGAIIVSDKEGTRLFIDYLERKAIIMAARG